MKNVLVLTSTFPRWKNDTTPGFVFYLSELLSKKYNIKILAPHYHKSKKNEKIGALGINRFQYFYPAKYQKLCYDGGILPNLKKSLLAKIQVPFFLSSELFSAKKLVNKEKINLIHAHWLIPQGLVGVILKKLYGIPLIVTVHAGDIFPLNNKFLKSIARFILNNCDVCTVNSIATKKAILNLTKNIKHIDIIPMGVDLDLFSPIKKTKSIKEKFRIKGPFLLTVGRLVQKKGVKYLFKAMPFVLKKFPGAKLVIVGDGPEKENLINLSKELKIENNVIFVGNIQNKLLPNYYATADIFILPSIITESGDTEGLGVVLLEAIASGTVVIGSNVGGIPDIIKDRKTGLLVDEKESNQISEAIIKLLSKRNLRKRLIRNGILHIEKNYSWKSVVDKFKETYDSI